MKQQIIILEGIDMVGKTTICQAFSKATEIPSFKQIYKDKWFDHTVDLLYGEEARIQMLEQLHFSAIFDRSYPSEYAYGKAYERQILEEKIWDIDKRYARLGAFIIYLYKPERLWQKDKTNLIETGMYGRIDKYFKEFLDKTHCPFMYLDTSDQDIDRQVLEIYEEGLL
jgi:thymidylate kinase